MHFISMIKLPEFRWMCLLGSMVLVLQGPLLAHAAEDAVKPSDEKVGSVVGPHSSVYAVINGRTVSTQEYEMAFASFIRQKFYHGKVPEPELAAAREDVKLLMIQRVVLVEEARRRGILPDANKINNVLAGYDSQYANNPDWKGAREQLLATIKVQLEEKDQVAQLEDQVRKLDEPSESDVRLFYSEKPDLFTEPEKQRLSVIMLRVDPSSPATAWEGTREEAKAIYNRLRDGANFAEAARLHSGMHAETGGDMGYLHKGMLPEAIQGAINLYEVGKVNPPVETLEGVAIFRLDERVPARKREFDDVALRAKDLLVRERQDQAWRAFVKKLVASADVKLSHVMSSEHREGGKK